MVGHLRELGVGRFSYLSRNLATGGEDCGFDSHPRHYFCIFSLEIFNKVCRAWQPGEKWSGHLSRVTVGPYASSDSSIFGIIVIFQSMCEILLRNPLVFLEWVLQLGR